MIRREFMSAALLTGGAAMADTLAPAFAIERPGFFRMAQGHGRSSFITPEGRPFFSLGLNHIDSLPLRYTEAGDLWQLGRSSFARSV